MGRGSAAACPGVEDGGGGCGDCMLRAGRAETACLGIQGGRGDLGEGEVDDLTASKHAQYDRQGRQALALATHDGMNDELRPCTCN